MIPLQQPGKVHGRVTTSSDKPLEGVSVQQYATLTAVKTNSSGEFDLLTPSEFVRFFLPGFRPTTKTYETLLRDSHITLQPDPQGTWSPQTCTVSSQADKVMVGDRMQFLLPSGAEFRYVNGDDYFKKIVCDGTYCMNLGWGALWGFGLPQGFLKEISITGERDVFLAGSPLQPLEYRGTKKDGTKTRWLGGVGESVSYENVPKDVAAYFDKIIDTLCWVQKH